MDPQEWLEGQGEGISLSAMDALVKTYKTAREDYEAAKRVASEKNAVKEEAEYKLVAALKAAGKKSYKVDGLGTFSVVFKEVVTVPVSLDKKRELFKWIGEQHGNDVLETMLGINYQTLNSFYNQEMERIKDPAFKMPGLDAPTTREEPRWKSS